MNKDVYNPNKLVHHKPALDEIAKGHIVQPVNLQIDWTNRCNNSCTWCYYDINPLGDFSRKDSIPETYGLQMLRDFKVLGGKSIEHTGGGEPTLIPYFLRAVEEAKQLGLGQAMVTNGKTLDGYIADAVKDFDWIRVSVDSASKEVYKQQHRTDSYDKVMANLAKFARIKDNNCVLGVSMITNQGNYQEMYEMTRQAKELGADNVRISLAYTPEKERIFDGIWEKVTEEIDKSKRLEDKDFKVFAFSNRIHDLAQKTGGGRCYYHHLTTAVGANGGVYPCCYFKYDPRYNMGNIKEQSLIDIWHGDKRKKFIKGTAEDCKASCWMTEKNKLADYITRDIHNVEHVYYP